jgi:hypothetical protein
MARIRLIRVEAVAKAKERVGSLQIMLWALWTAAVAGTGWMRWHADMLAQRPFNLIGMLVYCGLVGTGGLVALTVLEMWLEPWRFM